MKALYLSKAQISNLLDEAAVDVATAYKAKDLVLVQNIFDSMAMYQNISRRGGLLPEEGLDIRELLKLKLISHGIKIGLNYDVSSKTAVETNKAAANTDEEQPPTDKKKLH